MPDLKRQVLTVEMRLTVGVATECIADATGERPSLRCMHIALKQPPSIHVMKGTAREHTFNSGREGVVLMARQASFVFCSSRMAMLRQERLFNHSTTPEPACNVWGARSGSD